MKQAMWAAAVGSAFLLCAAVIVFAQGTPAAGPVNPTPPESLPVTKPGADLVINPSAGECKMGWDANMKWTKQQFEEFLRQLARGQVDGTRRP
jgi:hypothetical protein